MKGATLYRWPDAARFGRVVPKTKFYEHAKLSAAVRERVVEDVHRVTWAYKLADSTVHLRGDSTVPEIQVFVIDAKADDVSYDVLTVIDKAVQFPVFFEINRTHKVHALTRMVAAHKLLGGPGQRLSAYFSTDWVPTSAPRSPLPPAVDLPALYAGLLAPMLPIPARPGERLADATDRVDQARRIEREIAGLEKRLRTEPQFNRKVELRRKILDQTDALRSLTQ